MNSFQVRNVVSQVRNEKEARRLISELLVVHGSQTAKNRIQEYARDSHQSVDEVVDRLVGNFMRSAVTRKPGGYVEC